MTAERFPADMDQGVVPGAAPDMMHVNSLCQPPSQLRNDWKRLNNQLAEMSTKVGGLPLTTKQREFIDQLWKQRSAVSVLLAAFDCRGL